MELVAVKTVSKFKLNLIKLALKLLPAPKPMVYVGEGASLNLCQNLSSLQINRLLVVTDQVLYDLGIVEPIVNALTEQGIDVAVYRGVIPDPTIETVRNGLELLNSHQCDAVMAVGGGSSIDTAKSIALAAGNACDPGALIGIYKAKAPSLPLFAIPTTSGTGSEVTLGAVITETQTHTKKLIVDSKLVPLQVALDPNLLKGMPPAITADTGIDALTHAVEAWISDMSNPESDFYAFQAISLIFKNLEPAYKNGNLIKARENMALAAHYAGLAINIAGIGYVHAFAHQLGGFYGLSHGRANAIVLPHILKFSRNNIISKLAKLSVMLEISPSNTSEVSAAEQFLDRIDSLLKAVNIETRCSKIKKADFEEIIDRAFTEAHGTYAVPKYMKRKNARVLLKALSAEPSF
jgi:alcohol dehydrogenase